MKVLVVSHSASTSLNQQLYAEMAARRGWDLRMVIPANWKDEFGNILDEKPWPGLDGKLEKVPVLNNGSIILHVYRRNWRRYLEREKFDAIYVNHEPYALATIQLCRANRKSRHRASFGFYSCQNITKQYPIPVRWGESMVYRESRFAFPITDAVDEVLQGKGFGGRSVVAALPFDPSLYRPQGRERDEKLIGRSAGQVVIGFVGRLTEAKGLRTLAAALGRIKDLDWKLVLIGKGDFEEGFQELIKGAGLEGRVESKGYIPHTETPLYLSALDILVLPSETQPNWKEQFGRVIPEALACGTAVIGSDSGEIPRLISKSGGGLIFPERDDRAFAEALRELITDPESRENRASRGRDWALRHVGLDGVIERMADTIEEEAGRL